jgi:hypothetical protein
MSRINSMKKLEQMDFYRRNFSLNSLMETLVNHSWKLALSVDC